MREFFVIYDTDLAYSFMAEDEEHALEQFQDAEPGEEGKVLPYGVLPRHMFAPMSNVFYITEGSLEGYCVNLDFHPNSEGEAGTIYTPGEEPRG